MSWFEYGVPTRRHLRKGVWLRVRSLPNDLLKKAKPLMRKGEFIDWVVVQEIFPKGKVLLEFWCRCYGDFKIDSTRHTVFSFAVDEDPTWVCEGDLGRGYKE